MQINRLGKPDLKYFGTIIGFIMLIVSGEAVADGACSFLGGAVAFSASQPSTAVYSSSLPGSGSSGMSCAGLFVGVLTSQTIKVTMTSTTNNLNLLNNNGSGDKIPYTVYADTNKAYPITINNQFNYGSHLSLLTLILGVGTSNIPLYVSTTPGANISAGTYTDTIYLSWDYELCAVGLIACITPLTGKGSSVVTVTLTVTSSCAINSTPSVNFNAQSLVEQFSPITQNVNVTCTKSSGYTSYFDNGANYSLPWRRMKSSQGNFLQYSFYVPSTTTIWGVTNPQAGIGTGLSQNIPYTVAINGNSAQSAPPVGAYVDTVSFVLSY